MKSGPVDVEVGGHGTIFRRFVDNVISCVRLRISVGRKLNGRGTFERSALDFGRNAARRTRTMNAGAAKARKNFLSSLIILTRMRPNNARTPDPPPRRGRHRGAGAQWHR